MYFSLSQYGRLPVVLFALSILVAVVGTPVAAQAQHADPELQPADLIFSLSSTLSTTTTTAGGIALIVVLTRGNSSPDTYHMAQRVELYLRANSLQLKQDLALGGGRTIQDLANGIVEDENLELFGSYLRQHRDELIALAEPETLDVDRVLAFVEFVGKILEQDELLAADLQSARRKLETAG